MKRRDFIKTVGITAAGTALLNRRGEPSARTSVQNDFDSVVVGAGSSGCVVANRLSADKSVRVLLLEAGGPTNNDPAVTTPGRWVTLVGSKLDWGYATEPEPGLQSRLIAFPRRQATGGPRPVHAKVVLRAHPL